RFRKAPGGLQGLGAQRRQKRRRVPGAESLLHVAAARREIERRRDGGSGHDGALLRVLAEPLGENVSAERGAEDDERRSRLSGRERANEKVQVCGIARMV